MQAAKKQRRLFHYTVGSKLESILREGELRCSTAFIEKGERPAVFLTFNPEWEKTANKMEWREGRLVSLNQYQTEKLGGGLFRIEVAPSSAEIGWQEYCRKSGIPRHIARTLKSIARREGSRVADWRMSFEPIHAANWLAVEVLRGGRWQKILGKEEILNALESSKADESTEVLHGQEMFAG